MKYFIFPSLKRIHLSWWQYTVRAAFNGNVIQPFQGKLALLDYTRTYCTVVGIIQNISSSLEFWTQWYVYLHFFPCYIPLHYSPHRVLCLSLSLFLFFTLSLSFHFLSCFLVFLPVSLFPLSLPLRPSPSVSSPM